MAIIGERSIIPNRGMIDRIGPRIGSVISWITEYKGLLGSTPVQEKMILMKIETSRTITSIWRKSPSASMTYSPNCFAFSNAASIASVNAARTAASSSTRRASVVVPPGEVTSLRSTAG